MLMLEEGICCAAFGAVYESCYARHNHFTLAYFAADSSLYRCAHALHYSLGTAERPLPVSLAPDALALEVLARAPCQTAR